VQVDPGRCRGSGVCRGRLPGIFEADDAGRTRVRGERAVDPVLSEVRALVFECPQQAIELMGDDFFDFPDVGP